MAEKQVTVQNETDHGVFVDGYGVVMGHEEAAVPEGEAVKQLIKDGTFSRASSSNRNKEGDGS